MKSSPARCRIGAFLDLPDAHPLGIGPGWTVIDSGSDLLIGVSALVKTLPDEFRK
jgi:hypothetical protein